MSKNIFWSPSKPERVMILNFKNPVKISLREYLLVKFTELIQDDKNPNHLDIEIWHKFRKQNVFSGSVDAINTEKIFITANAHETWCDQIMFRFKNKITRVRIEII